MLLVEMLLESRFSGAGLFTTRGTVSSTKVLDVVIDTEPSALRSLDGSISLTVCAEILLSSTALGSLSLPCKTNNNWLKPQWRSDRDCES